MKELARLWKTSADSRSCCACCGDSESGVRLPFSAARRCERCGCYTVAAVCYERCERYEHGRNSTSTIRGVSFDNSEHVRMAQEKEISEWIHVSCYEVCKFGILRRSDIWRQIFSALELLSMAEFLAFSYSVKRSCEHSAISVLLLTNIYANTYRIYQHDT